MIRVSIETVRRVPQRWEQLAPFATNAFMNPIALAAAVETMGDEIVVLLAWRTSEGDEKLVGWWALAVKRVLLWRYLTAPAYDYAFLSTPVLDPAHAADAIAAFFTAIRADRALPNVLRIKDIDAADPAFAAIGAKSGAHLELARDDMPVAGREGGLKRSGSTRKKLRQDWNRLAAKGRLELVDHREASPVAQALETFLEMEQAGWKGKKGTALLDRARDAAFARRFIADMAAAGAASVALLELDGKAIAAQVLLYQGRQAFTWKTSYDPAFSRYSPGALLVDRISTELIDSGAVDMIDSCSMGAGFMAGLWSGRKPVSDLVVSVAGRASVRFLAVAGYFVARNAARRLRDRLARRK